MSKITTVLNLIETDAEKALAWLTKEGVKLESHAPIALAALGVLLTATEKALADAASAAGNPTQLILSLQADIADFKAVWPDLKDFASKLGIKL